MALLAALAGVGGLAALWLRPMVTANFGVVDPGRVIRAAQPTTNLPALIAENHLASILNLRGGSFRDPWYAEEVQTTADRGVAFYDVPLSATRRPGRHELLAILDVIATCDYPLLIHCKAGADRTGLASALYRMVRLGEGPRQASRAFTIYHSHLPLFGPEHLHEPLEEYAAWLEARGLDHTPERFRDWVRDEYRSDDPHTDPPRPRPGPRAPAKSRKAAPEEPPRHDIAAGPQSAERS
ncbi:fused DSP-PTPase phosphatase/NAD kinase-like protein [Aquisphaera insulae]|uniref:fused DSP-PTPase phosphatase/NAD kinase-like protein n=1 Tax=Aquisphaera insulae TaxID=2712864 RepID=UPI0013EC3E85|nr:tyrosine-protein phosphatase [Aquisphaera insulae]